MNTKIDEGIWKIYKFFDVTLPMEDPILVEEGLSFNLDNANIVVGIEKYLNGYGVVIYKAVVRYDDSLIPFRDTFGFQRGIFVFSVMQQWGSRGYAMTSGYLWEYICKEFRTPIEVIKFVLSKIFRVDYV